MIDYRQSYITEIVARERALYLSLWRTSSCRQGLVNKLNETPIWRARVQRHWEEGLLRREPYFKMSYKTAAKFHNQIRFQQAGLFVEKVDLDPWSSKEYLSSWKEVV